MTEFSADDYPIGTFPSDFHDLCQDCLRADDVGNVAFRETHTIPDKEAEIEWHTYRGADGCKRRMPMYPSKSVGYCYYHAKARGLLNG